MLHHREATARRGLELVDRPCPTCGARAHTTEASGQDYEYGTTDDTFSFVQCDRCDTLYLQPRPARRDFGVIYPSTYYAHAEARGAAGTPPAILAAWRLVERWRARELVTLVGDGPRRVLDVGCGDGRLLAALRDLGGAEWTLVGVEPGLSDAASRRARDLDLELHDGLYEELELGARQMDLIVAQQVLEHTVEPRAALAKMHRELRPGGYAVIDTPNADGLDRRLFRRSLWGGYHFPRHMTLFTPVTLADAAGRAGFEVVQVRPLLSPVFWIMSLHNRAAASGCPPWVTSRLTYRSLPLLAAATALDAPILLLTGRTSNMRALLRRPE